MKKDMKDMKGKTGAGEIVPLGDRVLIRELTEDEKERKTDSGIIIPMTVNEDKGAKRGVVVATGKGRYEDGKLIAPEVKEADQVLFNWGDKIKVGNDEFFMVREGEIIAVIR